MQAELEQEIIGLIQRYVKPTMVASRVGQQVDAAGLVTYDFDGHVHADGLDLDEAQAEIPTSNNSIAWLDTAGKIAERIFGRAFPGTVANLQLQANHLMERIRGQVALEAYGKTGGLARIAAEADEGSQQVLATASGVESRVITNNGGGSSFPQLPPGIVASPRRLSYGRVNGAGEVVSGDGFTAARLGVGLYQINLEPERKIAPGVAAVPETAAAIPVFAIREVGKASFRIQIWNFAGGVALDCPFSFVALG